MSNMNNESMVYLNKVFSDLHVKSCPLMSALTATSENFNQQLTFFDPREQEGRGCSCSCSCGSPSGLGQDEDLNFVIDSTEVIVSDFDLANPGCIDPCNVTVDGIPVDSIDFFNERYMAATNDLMSRVGDCACMERGRSTKTYFMIAGVGGFRAKLTIVLRGSVFGCGVCKKFKLLMSTKNNVFVNIPGQSTFASADLCLPCTTGGIAPVINFSFDADATLLNPTICVNQHSTACDLTVTGCLVAEPAADVQVTRQTLFRTNARSINVPCDDIAKCRQFPGVCGEEDDDSNAVSLRNRCCDDGREDDEAEHDHCGNHDHQCGCGGTGGCTCGCDHGHDHDRDCDCDRNRDRNRDRDRDRRQSISFQFNGRNGCSF